MWHGCFSLRFIKNYFTCVEHINISNVPMWRRRWWQQQNDLNILRISSIDVLPPYTNDTSVHNQKENDENGLALKLLSEEFWAWLCLYLFVVVTFYLSVSHYGCLDLMFACKVLKFRIKKRKWRWGKTRVPLNKQPKIQFTPIFCWTHRIVRLLLT